MFSSLPFECLQMTKFDVADVRGLLNRPKYERLIMMAALQEKKSVELVYEHKIVATHAHQRLQHFGFTVEKLKSRKLPAEGGVIQRAEFYFNVSW